MLNSLISMYNEAFLLFDSTTTTKTRAEICKKISVFWGYVFEDKIKFF